MKVLARRLTAARMTKEVGVIFGNLSGCLLTAGGPMSLHSGGLSGAHVALLLRHHPKVPVM